MGLSAHSAANYDVSVPVARVHAFEAIAHELNHDFRVPIPDTWVAAVTKGSAAAVPVRHSLLTVLDAGDELRSALNRVYAGADHSEPMDILVITASYGKRDQDGRVVRSDFAHQDERTAAAFTAAHPGSAIVRVVDLGADSAVLRRSVGRSSHVVVPLRFSPDAHSFHTCHDLETVARLVGQRQLEASLPREARAIWQMWAVVRSAHRAGAYYNPRAYFVTASSSSGDSADEDAESDEDSPSGPAAQMVSDEGASANYRSKGVFVKGWYPS